MSIHNSDNLTLVAPRPVRLVSPAPYSPFAPSFLHRPQANKASAAVRFVSAPAEAFERLKLSAENEDDLSAERDRPISPLISPMYVYPPFLHL
jgi:hypothetical protein